MDKKSSCERMFEKTLLDVERAIYEENWNVSNEDLKLGGEWMMKKCRLRGGPSDGVDVVEVNNGPLSFIIVPTRGMGIWKGCFKGAHLGWDSPVKNLVHPSNVDLEARGGLGWLDGFNEWIVRCGLESFGAPGLDAIIDNNGNKKEVILTLHGRIANKPASALKAIIGLEPPYYLGVKGVVYERSMFGSNLKIETMTKTALGSNSINIVDVVENLRSIPDEMQLLYHCNYGAPFLEEGSRFLAPVMRVVPRDARAVEGIDEYDLYGSPEAGFVEQVYFFNLVGDEKGHTLVALMNRDETKAVSIAFSLNELPCFTLWKNTNALEEGYVTGLEPGTSFPNIRAFERAQNRVVKLKTREKHRAEISLSVHIGKDEVQKVRERIDKLQKTAKPKVFKKPIKEFSPT